MNRNLTVPRAARNYGVTEDQIQAAIESGDLQLHPKRIWRLLDHEVEAWIAKTRGEQSEQRR